MQRPGQITRKKNHKAERQIDVRGGAPVPMISMPSTPGQAEEGKKPQNIIMLVETNKDMPHNLAYNFSNWC
jgi:hypothetical protein